MSLPRVDRKCSLIVFLLIVWVLFSIHLLFGIRSQKEQNSTTLKISTNLLTGYNSDRRAAVEVDIAPASDFCEDLHFLVVVKTRTSPNRRDEFRETYGRMELTEKFRYKLLFPLGFDLNATVNESIEKEAKKHGDILRGLFYDRFDTLTEKALLYSRYIASSCHNVSAIVNIDDDVGFNVGLVASYAKEKVTEGSYHCLVMYGKPVRDPSSKYYVSRKDYWYNEYPLYCSGPATIYTPLTVQKIVAVAQKAKYIIIDDVFVSGLLTKLAGVNLTNMDGRDVCIFSCDYEFATTVKYGQRPRLFAYVGRENTERLFYFYNAPYLKWTKS